MSKPRTKRQTKPDKYLRSTIQLVDGMGEKGMKSRPFRYDHAIAQFRSWVYRAMMLNAGAVSATPLRMYARNRRSATKLYATKGVSRTKKRYLCGDAAHRPSKAVLHKIAEIGDDFEEVTEPHPALTLLSTANPWQNGFDLSQLMMLYLQATGNAYLHPVMNGAMGPGELWLMPSQWMNIIPSRDEFIKGYLYGRKPDQYEFAPDEVIQFKLPNLADVHYGMGWVEALWTAIGLHNSKRTVDTAKYDNFCRPDWLLVVKSGAGDGALNRLESAIEGKLRGARNSGRFLSVSGDVEAIPLNFEDVEIGDPDKLISEIAAVSGVSLNKLLGNDPVKANSEIQDVSWLRDTVLPYCRLIEEQLNARYLPLFGIGDDAVLAYDCPVPEDEMREADIAIKRAGGPITTVNEEREDLGKDALDGGDELRDPSMDAATAMMGMMATQQGTAEATTGGGGAPSVGAGAEVQQTLLNGTQMTAMQGIVEAVTAGTIPRDSGVNMLAVGLQISTEQADQIMGSAGTQKPTVANPNPAAEAQAQAEHDRMLEQTEASKPPPKPAKGMRVVNGTLLNSTIDGLARKLPQGTRLVPILRAAFEAQEQGVLASIGKSMTKADGDITAITVDLRALAPNLAKDAQPILAGIMAEQGKRLLAKLGADFHVFERNIPKAAQEMSVKLAESINETTSSNIAVAVQKLRDEVAEGLVVGDTRTELANRVKNVFENATASRAETIARTEASKAAHQGELMGARDSGVVSKKFWLASADACPICDEIASDNPDGVALDATFDGVDSPPAHPNCQCSLTYSIRDDGD